MAVHLLPSRLRALRITRDRALFSAPGTLAALALFLRLALRAYATVDILLFSGVLRAVALFLDQGYNQSAYYETDGYTAWLFTPIADS